MDEKIITIACKVDDKDSTDSFKQYTAVTGHTGQEYYIHIANERDLIKGHSLGQLKTNLLSHFRDKHPVLRLTITASDPEAVNEIRELINILRV